MCPLAVGICAEIKRSARNLSDGARRRSLLSKHMLPTTRSNSVLAAREGCPATSESCKSELHDSSSFVSPSETRSSSAKRQPSQLRLL